MHYFFQDLIGIAAATPLAVLLIVAPGFGILRLMRRAGLIVEEGSSTLCWALLLGPVVLPALDALLLRWPGMPAVLALHLALVSVGARLAFQTARKIPARWWMAVAGAWLAVVWANVDFDWHGRLYQSVTVVDTVKHAAVIAALAKEGVPFHDPFFARTGIAGYYYYFYVSPALIHWIGGTLIDARAAFAAGAFVTLIAFPAMLVLLADAAALVPEGARRRFVCLTLLLCCVSGLDLLPSLRIWSSIGHPLAQLDWWSDEVRWGLTSILWVPHHITAVIAFYTGSLLIAATRGPLIPRVVCGGAAFATAFGSSLWIAVAAAPVVAVWWIFDRIKRRPGIGTLPLSGGVALLLSAPQISDIFVGRSVSGPPLSFYLRPWGPVKVMPHSVTEWIIYLAGTPGGFLIEFGIFAIGSALFLLRGQLAMTRSTPIGRLLLVGAPLALIMVTFLHSTVLNNDFGWRAVWLAQVPALLWTASILSTQQLRTSPGLSTMLALGLAATIWDIAGMRLIRPYFILDYINANPDVDFDLRGAYAWADRNLASGVLLQHNPTRAYRALDWGLYSDRRVAVSDAEGRLFGADQKAVAERLALVGPMFARAMTAKKLEQRSSAAGVGALVLTSADPLWRGAGGPPENWKCQYRTKHSCVMLMENPQ